MELNLKSDNNSQKSQKFNEGNNSQKSQKSHLIEDNNSQKSQKSQKLDNYPLFPNTSHTSHTINPATQTHIINPAKKPSVKKCIEEFAKEFYRHCLAGNQDKLMTLMELGVTATWIFDGRIHEEHGNNPYYRVLMQNTMFLLAASASNILSKKLTILETKYLKVIFNEMFKNAVLLAISLASVFVNHDVAITGAQQTNNLVQNKLGISSDEMKIFDIDSYLFVGTLPAILLSMTYLMSFKQLYKQQSEQIGHDSPNNNSKFKLFLKFMTPLLCAGTVFAGSLYSKHLGSDRPIEFSGLTPEEMQFPTPEFWRIMYLGQNMDPCINSENANFPSGHSIMGGVCGSTLWILSNLFTHMVNNPTTSQRVINMLLKCIGVCIAIYTASFRVLADCHTTSAAETGVIEGLLLVQILFDMLQLIMRQDTNAEQDTNVEQDNKKPLVSFRAADGNEGNN